MAERGMHSGWITMVVYHFHHIGHQQWGRRKNRLLCEKHRRLLKTGNNKQDVYNAVGITQLCFSSSIRIKSRDNSVLLWRVWRLPVHVKWSLSESRESVTEKWTSFCFSFVKREKTILFFFFFMVKIFAVSIYVHLSFSPEIKDWN